MAEPTNVTIHGAPEGFNCSLSIANFGSRVVRATGIGYGVDITASATETRDDAAFYTLNVTDSAFTLTCIFKTAAERDNVANWLSGWAKAVSGNRNVGGYITVRCPARRFTRTAVLSGGLVFGDTVGTVTYPLTLTFIGAEDPTSAVGKTDVAGDSSFQAATKDKVDAPMFYPAYYVNGATGDSTESVIYDRQQAEKANAAGMVNDVKTGFVDPLLKTLGSLFGGGG